MLDLEGWSLINSEYALLTSVNRTLIFFFSFMSFIPLLSTQGPFSNKVFSFVSMCVFLASSFRSIKLKPTLGPGRGFPSCNRTMCYNLSWVSSLHIYNGTSQPP